jgi:hypothetical protein
MAASRTSPATDLRGSRKLLLAGIGLAVVVRREAGKLARATVDNGRRIRRDAVAMAGDARDLARGIGLTLIERSEPVVSACAAQAGAVVVPVLARFGLSLPGDAQAPAAPTRKPAPRERRQATSRKAGAH